MMDYTLKRVARTRNLRVRVEPTGTVAVTAPRLVPKIFIDQFVKQHQPWIDRQRRRVALTKTAFPTFDWEGKVVSYLGKLYDLRFKIHDSRIKIIGSVISYSPITGNEGEGKKMISSWLKREGEAYILRKLPELADLMGTHYGRVSFRQQRSRWGSCSGRGDLSFNWRLVHFSPQVIDYVIIHELAHTVHHDHSKDFWKLVARYCSAYKEHVRFLKRQMLEII